MLNRAIALVAAFSLAAPPCLAADLVQFDEAGARRSGAGLGAYFEVPFGGPRAGRASTGVRLTVTHDYRVAGASGAPVVRADAFDLRLAGDRRPTLYMAGEAVTGDEARRSNLTGAGTIVTVAILAAAVVGGIVIWNAIDDSGEE